MQCVKYKRVGYWKLGLLVFKQFFWQSLPVIYVTLDYRIKSASKDQL
jgi:hypothetical protein